jgi:hypothetical protein
MADVKISQLPAATTPVAGTEVLAIVQSGTTSQVSINAATGITRPFTSGGVVYASSSSALATGSALTFDGTNFATTGSVTSAGSSNSGNLTFTGTGNRITGNFSNATAANRVAFQTSTVNGSTQVNLIPNGTSTDARLFAYANSADLSNSSFASFGVTTTSEVRTTSGISGTGTYLPMTFYTGGSERVRIDTSGNVGIGTSSPASKFNVSGSFNAGGTANYPAILSGGSYGGGFGMQDGTGVSGIYVQSSGTQMVFFTGQTSADSATSKALMYLDTGLGIGGTASASAILDAQSTTKGVRMPNMTTTQKNAISSPAAGLIVFDTTLAKLSVYSGTAWQTITSV